MFNLRKLSRTFTVCSRLMSSSQAKPLVGVSVDNEGIATLQLQRKPVNSFTLELLQELHDSVCEVEKNKCKGLILTSDLPTVFSAGLDLYEFRKPDPQRLLVFQDSIFNTAIKLFGTDLITTVAINGYAGAGACAVIAFTCDYRAMTCGPATIGLNDTAVGIIPGMWIYELMSRLMGPKNTEYALTSSIMYSAEKALQVGLIDEVAADKEDAIEKCKAFIKSYDQISPVIRAATKRSIRQQYITKLEEYRKNNAKYNLNRIESSEFQDNLEQYIQSIKNRKNAKLLNK